MKESTPEAIQEWFDTFECVKREYDVALKDIYNMDETGFSIGLVQHGKVIINSEIRSQFQANPGRQEWVTTIECICIDGGGIDPLIIFKGAKIASEWVHSVDIPDTWTLSCSNKGWTSDVHGLQWLRQCFEPATREKANGETESLSSMDMPVMSRAVLSHTAWIITLSYSDYPLIPLIYYSLWMSAFLVH